jgi:hypothetical protein
MGKFHPCDEEVWAYYLNYIKITLKKNFSGAKKNSELFDEVFDAWPAKVKEIFVAHGFDHLPILCNMEVEDV